MSALIIFVDALPYDKLDLLPKINTLLEFRPLIPGYGYSVNVHYEIFKGLGPDDVMFFGDWQFNPNFRSNQKKYNLLEQSDILLEKFNANLIRKAIRKIFLKIDDMIPFQRRDFFKQRGSYLIPKLAENNSFLNRKFSFYLEELDRKNLPQDDNARFLYLDRKINEVSLSLDNVFISLYCMDHFGHIYGPNSQRYSDILPYLDDLLFKIVTTAKNKDIVIISDHGMAEPKGHVSLKYLENELKAEFGRTIVYYYDSLYFKAWSLASGESLNRVEEILSGYPGKILSQDERNQYRLSSNSHGDLIFLLNEGYAFHPNYFGHRKLFGYHGYGPRFNSQYGILGTFGEENKSPVNSLEIREYLIRKFGR